MQIPGVPQEISIHPFNASVSEGMGETAFIDWIWSKRRDSPEFGKADRLASLQGTMWYGCQNPPGEITPGDPLPSSLAQPRCGEVLVWALVAGPTCPGRWGLTCSLQPP